MSSKCGKRLRNHKGRNIDIGGLLLRDEYDLADNRVRTHFDNAMILNRIENP